MLWHCAVLLCRTGRLARITRDSGGEHGQELHRRRLRRGFLWYPRLRSTAQEDAAATVLQAYFRGAAMRRHALLLALYILQLQDEEAAARTIQSTLRGRRARQELQRRRLRRCFLCARLRGAPRQHARRDGGRATRGGRAKSRPYAAVALATTVKMLFGTAAARLEGADSPAPARAARKAHKARYSAPRAVARRGGGRAAVAQRMRATHQIRQPSKMN